MTNPKIEPCPDCGSSCAVYKYESGWSRVECEELNECGYVGPTEGRNRDAIRAHNKRVEEKRARGAA